MIKHIFSKIYSSIMRVHNQKTLFYFFLCVLLLPNIILAITESLTPLERVCNIVLPFGFYYLIVTMSKRLSWAILILFPISLLAGVQLVLLYLYGRSVVATDMFLNFITTDTAETMELMSNIYKILIVVLFLYIPPLIYAIIAMFKGQKLAVVFLRRNRYVAIGVVFVGLSLLAVCYASNESYSLKKDVYPLNACYNMYKAVSRNDKLKNYRITSKDFKYNATSSHAKDLREIYVVVIGETSRAANWELYGYKRETNPKLKDVEDLILFERVLTEANITHKSVPMLLSSASSVDFDKIYSQKSMITAFKEAGFKTAFYSNHAHTQTLGDNFGSEADVCVYLRDTSDEEFLYDGQLVELMKSEIAKGAQKQLIVLHTYGSYFNYYSRYPLKSTHFKPDSPIAADKKHYKQLINAYDNSIRYTDEILYDIIKYLESLKGVSSSMMYVSDHGEALFDHGEDIVLHSSTSPTFYHLHVPMVMWCSSVYKEVYPDIIESLKSHRKTDISSSAAFFHTVLGISGIETIYRDDSYSLASRSYMKRQYVYLNEQYNSEPVLHIDMSNTNNKLLYKFIRKGNVAPNR